MIDNQKCPYCGSGDIYFSKKRKIYVCEDCDKTFDAITTTQDNAVEKSGGGMNLFFSYGHDKNKQLVERIKKDLERRGHNVWIDTSEIKAGDHWRDDILNGVINSACVVAFLSEHSTRQPGVCLDELKIAVCVKGADVKTVLLEPENKIKQPATISEIQWLDMSEWYEIMHSPTRDFEEWYKEKFSELCRVIESRESVELNGDIQNLKEKLLPYLNSEKEYGLLAKEFHGRKWLEEHINNWCVTQTTKSLIVYGSPGSGKSAFSVNFSHYNADVYGCFLCEWNKEYTINPNKFIRTMAFKLATKIPDYRRLLLLQLQNKSNLEEMKNDDLFDYLLTYPLSNLVDGNRKPGIIVVDGLDEAETDGKNPLAEVFSKCVERLPNWIRFVFTSRPEKNIRDFFSGCDSIDIVNDMPDGYNDIMAYLVRTLADVLYQLPNKLEILNKICEASEGSFLYAELLANDIKNNNVDIYSNNLPKGLNAFYSISMKRKFKCEEDFANVRDFLEILVVSEIVPEELVINVCEYTQYLYLKHLDCIGSWIVRNKINGVCFLGFTHKSISDWFVDESKSLTYFVDQKKGALKLARTARKMLNNVVVSNDKKDVELKTHLENQISLYYAVAGKYDELEEFLIEKSEELYPFWFAWKKFPDSWKNNKLIHTFWNSTQKNDFLEKLQQEGSTEFILWIYEKIKEEFSVGEFDKTLFSIYMDMIHLSGDYSKAVEIANEYLKKYSLNDISSDEFLSMLCVRKIHHSMFYVPLNILIDEAIELFEKADNHYIKVKGELLFLIGGNLGVLSGDWKLANKWLGISEIYAQENKVDNLKKRNARKRADLYCQNGDYEKAKKLVLDNIQEDGSITDRYEAYLVATLANIYTYTGDIDNAIQCYNKVLYYTTSNGISGWSAHANLGIANANYRLGNLKETLVFAERAKSIYQRIHQEWGMIMTDALLSACESKMGTAPIKVACASAINKAKQMNYGSCVSAIEELSNEKNNFLKLYYI